MNRLISRLILVFATSSLAVTVVPLLQGGAGAPLAAWLDRGRSLVLYSAYLTLFLVFVLPGFMGRGNRGDRVPVWGVLAALLLVFAAIPLVFTAYISGVSKDGLLVAAAICAAAAGLTLFVGRLGGGRARTATWALGSIACFALPAIALFMRSLGRQAPAWFDAASPLTWLHRVARLRETPDATPFLIVAGALWLGALLPLGRRRAAVVATAGALLVATLAGAWNPPASGPGPAHQEVPGARSLAGGVARPGLRTPLAVRPPASGSFDVTLGGFAARVAGPGPQTVLAVPGPGDLVLGFDGAGGTITVPAPFVLVPDSLVLVGAIGSALPEGLAGTREGLRVVPLEPDHLPLTRGALEAFDVLALEASTFAALGDAAEAALERWTALGGRLLLLEADRSETISVGLGTRVTVSAGEAVPRSALGPRAPSPGALDEGLLGSFARPDWQEMDLSALLLFTVSYHLVFLAAFLLPLLLDSRKAIGVYLVSVSFVVVLMSFLAYQVLGSIFLRDNQVYTQAFTLLVQGSGSESPLVSRQFLCFASMSGEKRDLAFPGDTDLMVYRGRPGRVPAIIDRSPGAIVLRDVELDRFRGKVMVRVDAVTERPLRLVPGPDAATPWRIAPVPGAADPGGLWTARLGPALEISGSQVVRMLAVDGLLLRDQGPPAGDDLGLTGEAFFRRLRGGGFLPAEGRFLVIRIEGLARPDQDANYLWSRDLGGFLILPLPEA